MGLQFLYSFLLGIGESFSFFDDPVFISKNGLSAIDKRTITLERSIACRSHNVNPKLLCENLCEASLAEWCGYLAIGVNGSVYLADSRAVFTHESGCREYEWFYLKDVGTYENAARVVHKAHEEGVSLRSACLELGYLTDEKFDEYFKPEKMV